MAEFNKKQYLDQVGLEALVGQIKTSDAALDKKIADEIERSTKKDGEHAAELVNLNTAITNEVTRAKAAEEANAKAVADEKTRAEAAEADLNTAITAETTRATKAEENLQKAINDINGEEGALAQTLAAAKSYADTEIGKEKTRAEGKEGELAQAIADEATRADAAEKVNAKAIADEVTRATKAEEDLQKAIDAHEEAVDGKLATLIGTDTDKSVREIANDELAKQLIPEGAQESLDTLAEIAAWIQEHPGDAAAMNKAIENLQKLIGTLPEGITATTVVGFVQELVTAEKTRAEEAEADLDERLADVEAAVGEGGSVATQITNAINELDADKTSATVEEGKGVQVQVVEVDGKITNVAVTGNYDNAYDAKGAAATAKSEATSYTDTEVDKAYDAIEAIPTSVVTGLFAPAE